MRLPKRHRPSRERSQSDGEARRLAYRFAVWEGPCWRPRLSRTSRSAVALEARRRAIGRPFRYGQLCGIGHRRQLLHLDRRRPQK